MYKLLEAYDFRLDMAAVDLHDLDEDEMAQTTEHHYG
jgi:hypothetical protein